MRSPAGSLVETDELVGRRWKLSELPGRIIALDYGRRRVGVAITDPSRTIATPLGVARFARGREEEIPERLLEWIREFRPTEILIGIPLHMDGTESEMAEEARALAGRLAATTGLPVVERDERLTTVDARRAMREMGMPRRKRREKGRDDMVAAALLLRGHLDAKNRC